MSNDKCRKISDKLMTSDRLIHSSLDILNFVISPWPSGGMADARDLKSRALYRACRFESGLGYF